MGQYEDKLKASGYDVEPPAAPGFDWMDRVVIVGDLAFVSGHTAGRGKLGENVTVEEGYKAAEAAMANLLRSLGGAIGGLDNVVRMVKVGGYVNSAPDFKDGPQVVHGASELLFYVFGEKGKHARAALGMAALPAGTAVEVDLVAQVRTS